MAILSVARRDTDRGEASASGSAPLCINPSGEPSPLPAESSPSEGAAAMPKETAGGRALGRSGGRAETSHEVAVLSTLKLRRGLPLAGEAGRRGLPRSAGDEGRLRVAPGDSDPSVGVKRGLLLDRLGGIGGGPQWVGEGVLEPAASMAAIALKPSPLAACLACAAGAAGPACACACAATPRGARRASLAQSWLGLGLGFGLGLGLGLGSGSGSGLG